MRQKHIITDHQIKNASLKWNNFGTPVSDNFEDVYFSNESGLEESRYVFLQNNQLQQRWQTYQKRRFVIGETGFGTGLNFLAVWQLFKAFRANHPDFPLKELHFISFEKFPVTKEDLLKAHQAWPELHELVTELQENYPITTPDCHRLMLDKGAITLDLWFGDVKACMPQVSYNKGGLVDAWFLDGFAPSKNPEMWSQTLFTHIAQLTKAKGTCATFTAAGFVRRGLIEAGFEMNKVKGFGHKREMLTGQLLKQNTESNHAPWYKRTTKNAITDIAIIGGGIASACLSHSLLNRGIKVTVYCKDEQTAQGASGNTQGAIYPLLNEKKDSLSRFFSSSFIFTHQFITQLSKQLNFSHQWCGVTQLKWDEKSTNKLNKMRLSHFPRELVNHLTIEQTNQTVGLPINMESLSYPLGGWLSPKQLTRAMFDKFSQNSLFTCHSQSEVMKLTQKENKQWQVHINNQYHTHQAVIIANGHRFTDFEQTADLPLTPVRGQVSHIPTNHELKKLNTVLCYDGYLTPEDKNNHTHCIGASYDRRNLNLNINHVDQVENHERLKKCIPNESWPTEINPKDNLARVGIRCASRDHLPLIGNVVNYQETKEIYKDLYKKRHWLDNAKTLPVYEGLFCMLALGSRGLCSAPLLAETLASQIVGDPLPMPVSVLDDLHPSRLWMRRLLKGKPLDI